MEYELNELNPHPHLLTLIHIKILQLNKLAESRNIPHIDIVLLLFSLFTMIKN